MIAIFAHDHLGEETRGSNTALLQTLRQGSDHRSQFAFFAAHKLAANNLASKKLCRPVVQHLGNLLPNTAEGRPIFFDFLGFDHLLFNRQILWPTFFALFLVQAFGDWF